MYYNMNISISEAEAVEAEAIHLEAEAIKYQSLPQPYLAGMW